jgi:hypothetical protein
VKASQMRDYWGMLRKVYNSLPPELLYPKDLRRAHDEIQARIVEAENAVTNEKIKKRAVELAKFILIDEDAGLMIRPAAAHSEFINEGKKLSHCVARYAEKHAAGSTNIFFIRKTKEPDKPFFTLELNLSKKSPEVIQNRGKNNCARTEEVQQFEEAWLEHVKNIISKEKKNVKRGHEDRTGELARAGA